MIDQLIEDERQRDRLLARIARAVLPFRATVVDGRPRSHKENRLFWVWLNEAASQLEDRTLTELQWEWKLRFGVPVLMEESNKFADTWALIERRHSYSERLRMMEWVDVTRLLSVKGFARMLEEIFRDCADNNIKLTDPEEGRYGPKIGSRMDWGGSRPSDPAAGEAAGSEGTKGEVRGLYTGLQRKAET